MTKGLVTVFGASGFLGRHVLRELVRDGWRIRAAVRRPHTAQDLRVNGAVGQIQLVQANLRFKQSVERAVDGADAVINLAGISYKKGRQTFSAVHTLGAKTVAEAAAARGITNIIHLSALSADKDGLSAYARSKAEGEAAVLASVPTADVLRTATMFGEGAGIFNSIARLAQLTPVIPLLGGGKTRLQPVYVGDVAKAVSTAVTRGSSGILYELAGPRSYTSKELIEFTLNAIDKKRLLVPTPWALGGVWGFGFETLGAIPLLNLLIKPFLTRDMVKGMKTDTVLSGDHPGFAELDVHVETVEAIVPPTLETFKTYGQFHQEASS
ncbi:MAG: complex I NDUFA9 subunit family protein [Robiginitomaculum sp.]|nr:MAG: complex I NDUFA9 subunit family protein [Robiginitomaculum sp.]